MFDFTRKRKTKQFGKLAIEHGLASEQDIEEALAIQKDYAENHNTYKEIGVILTEKGVLTPNDVTFLLKKQKKGLGLIAWFAELFNLSR